MQVYAYFVTINASYTPIFPYVIGLKYYGVVVQQNANGKTLPTEAVTVYYYNSATVNLVKFSILLRVLAVSIMFFLDAGENFS